MSLPRIKVSELNIPYYPERVVIDAAYDLLVAAVDDIIASGSGGSGSIGPQGPQGIPGPSGSIGPAGPSGSSGMGTGDVVAAGQPGGLVLNGGDTGSAEDLRLESNPEDDGKIYFGRQDLDNAYKPVFFDSGGDIPVWEFGYTLIKTQAIQGYNNDADGIGDLTITAGNSRDDDPYDRAGNLSIQAGDGQANTAGGAFLSRAGNGSGDAGGDYTIDAGSGSPNGVVNIGTLSARAVNIGSVAVRMPSQVVDDNTSVATKLYVDTAVGGAGGPVTLGADPRAGSGIAGIIGTIGVNSGTYYQKVGTGDRHWKRLGILTFNLSGSASDDANFTGLNGNLDGGYRVSGNGTFANGNNYLLLQPDGANPGSGGCVASLIGTNGGAASTAFVRTLQLDIGYMINSVFSFELEYWPISGFYKCRTDRGGGDVWSVIGRAPGGNITSLKLHALGAGGNALATGFVAELEFLGRPALIV